MVISKKDKKMLECKNDFTFCECVGCSKKRADVGSFQVRNIIRSKFHELEKENEELKEAFHKIIGELTSTIPDWSTSREICDSVNYDLDTFDWKEQSE